jgi:uncharacterized protein with HEPN domain
MIKSPRPYIVLIQRALTQIEHYRPPNRDAYFAWPMAQDAIVMRLQEIGENLARIRRLDENAFSNAAPDSWLKLIGLRNVISHAYDSIDHDAIWQIVTEEPPAFAATLDAVADNLP